MTLDTKATIFEVVEQTIAETKASPSIHDLLANERVLSLDDKVESSLEPTIPLSPGEDEGDDDKGLDNPPSLIFDINFNVSPASPTTAIKVVDDDFGEFSQEFKSEEAPISDECSSFGTPQESIASPREDEIVGESPLAMEKEEEEIQDDIPPIEDQQSPSSSPPPDIIASEKTHVDLLEEDDFGAFSENEQVVVITQVTEVINNLVDSEETKTEQVNNNSCLDNIKEDFCDVSEIPCVQQDVNEDYGNDGDDDEFDDFAEFSSAPSVVSPNVVIQSQMPVTPSAVEFEADFNQFANFETFPEVQNVPENVVVKAIMQDTLLEPVEDDDDDDFGDFTSSVAPQATASIPTVIPVVVEAKLPAIDISNMASVLEEMFGGGGGSENENMVVNSEKTKAEPTKMLVEISNYDTTALATEFQWSKSMSNKCLVKSLGIDTRNIVSRAVDLI